MEQIRREIENISKKIDELQAKKIELMKSMCSHIQNDFEKQMNIKPGDRIKCNAGGEYFFKCIDLDYMNNIVVICNRIKLDGTPSKQTSQIPLFKFGVRI